VSFEGLETLASVKVPDLEALVVTGTHEKLAVRGPGHVRYSQLMTRYCLLMLAVPGAPDFQLLISSFQLETRLKGLPLKIDHLE